LAERSLYRMEHREPAQVCAAYPLLESHLQCYWAQSPCVQAAHFLCKDKEYAGFRFKLEIFNRSDEK
jgi:hypothetical protein